MHNLSSFLSSTLGRKVLMALSGIVLVLFVLGHMLGNLQIFLGAEVINAYAYKLHHELPTELLWAVRLVLLATIGVHIWAAVSLTLDNRRARPDRYDTKKTVQASYASRTMRMARASRARRIPGHWRWRGSQRCLHTHCDGTDPAQPPG